MFVFALAVVSALLSSFLCSVSEAVLLSVTHAQIEALGRSRAADILRRFKREIETPVAAILTLNTAAHTMGASIAGAFYGDVFPAHTLWKFSALFTVAVLLFSEILPKTLGVTFAKNLATPVAYFVSVLMVVLKPALFLTRLVSRAVTGGNERPVTSMEEIRTLAELGRNEGVVAPRTADMIEGAAALRELTVYDVMVPRGNVVFLSGMRTVEENLETIRRVGHSRFPFSPTGELDGVKGIVLVKDLMFQLHDTPGEPHWDSLLGSFFGVPARQPLERLLRTFQLERRHMALVVDEYGGIQGIVTLEDVLEEIVGEIEDESDRVDPFIVRRPDDTLLCRGLAETRKVFDLLGVEEETEMVSIGGLVAELLGRVPRAADHVDFHGYRFTVLVASARRAERIEVRYVGPGSGSMRPPPLDED